MKLSIHENMFLDKYHKHAAFFVIPQRFMASQQPQPYLFSNWRAQQTNWTQTEMPQTKISVVSCRPQRLHVQQSSIQFKFGIMKPRGTRLKGPDVFLQLQGQFTFCACSHHIHKPPQEDNTVQSPAFPAWRASVTHQESVSLNYVHN